ncbi:amino acid/amide ABC transporter membrane protein 2, HAAT family [Ruegeria halocynthiae]|uniref:Amino acid/amide ABC transporter membrane protein 2, HAAT family n=1 Tax=Ruegeria halocynthiae TaxID=985054 RepID=A0A1H2TA88_9RHOB|nr:branched-chain amino acid ABC transporter permease [Ruegeria halocynthiae]SDW40801.1 amino acid/amide ABC transporter membrane protein 2, HAAT family [Ruegeria halocynthiae]
MSEPLKNTLLFVVVGALIVLTGFTQSWNAAILIINMGLISAIMSIGVNLQWGFAGLFNVGVMGFVALGGLAVVLVSTPPTPGAWSGGGYGVILSLLLGAATVVAAVMVAQKMPKGRTQTFAIIGILVVGFFVYRAIFDPNVASIEAIDPAVAGNIGGLNLPVLFAWPAGGLLAAGAAWLIGKTALGLRSDYLAIATLGIAEIIIAVMKNEDWLARGVKNVYGIPRPAPVVGYEVELQQDPSFLARAEWFGLDPVTASTLSVKLGYSLLFLIVLLVLLWMAQMALKSPWGRMMRAIRDNEVAAEAMGKDVTRRHLQIFVLGSAICGIAGAMMTTLDGQLTPGTYNPLRFTFLVWVMVIVGGSGNNFGAVLGAFLIWFLWVQVEPMGLWLMNLITSGMPDGSALKAHLIESAAHMRLFTMGLILLIVLRFSPRGLIPEK